MRTCGGADMLIMVIKYLQRCRGKMEDTDSEAITKKAFRYNNYYNNYHKINIPFWL
jgi:hypothetical protein